jgi:hypothetical protein
MTRLRERGGWALSPTCPCDLHFLEYFAARGYSRKRVFHFGCGLHHIVGRELSKGDGENEVLSITASRDEINSYVDAVLSEPDLARRYRVLFGDLYTLPAGVLPSFDIVTLFHLCEPPDADRPEIVPDAVALVGMFLSRLRPGGEILFYANSSGRELTRVVLSSLEAMGRIEKTGALKSLVVYSTRAARGTDPLAS